MRCRTRSRWHRDAARLVTVATEQILCAELAELFERTAGLLEQRVLLALHGERVELARDRVQIALQAAELLERLVDLRLQRLWLLRHCCVHERPALDLYAAVAAADATADSF